MDDEFKGKNFLQNIKSSFIIKKVFSFLKEKPKLKMIIHNKQLQKIFGLDIDDYRRRSGKYKILEKNGKGKEYKLNSNLLLFEGEYLNGEKNGKGKEYYYGNLIFEGEYLNGERNGRGKEYNYRRDELIFEGEYLNGQRWNGKGKEYCKYLNNEELIFEGEYLKGERSGKGKEFYHYGKMKYKGEYLKGQRNGKGREYYAEKKN